MIKTVTLLVIIFSSNMMLCFANEPNKKTLTIATELWPPYYTQEDGQGLYQMIIEHVFDDRKIVYLYTSYDVSKKLVEKKQADMWLGAYQDEEDFAITPKVAFDIDRVAVLYIGSRTKKDLLSALKNASVTWKKGYDYHQYLPEFNLQYYEVPDIDTGLKMLALNRVEFYLEDLDDISEHLSSIKNTYLNFEMNHLTNLYVFPSFNNNPEGRTLAAQWDKKMKVMKQDGSLKKIFDQYEEPYLFDEISDSDVLIILE